MRIKVKKELIPWAMAAGRAGLGPVLIAGAVGSWNGFALAGTVITALVSDIYDGVLARRWRCDTAAVRLFDSMADTVFYLCTAVALWVYQPQMLHHYAGLFVSLLAFAAARLVLDFLKFGKPASYHSYLAKTWGLVMAIAVVGVFASHHENALVPLALVLGILCDLEGVLMSLIMPVWRKDIKTLRTAWKLRNLDRHQKFLSSPANAKHARLGQNSYRNMRRHLVNGFFVLLLSSIFAVPTFAVEAGQVAYTSGTLTVAQGTIGSLDIRVPTTLVFKFTAATSGSGEIDIPYDKITGFVYRTEVAHHIGVLPAIAVSLVKRRERKHYFTINFNDPSGTAQVAIFEVPKQDPPALLATLRSRSPQACKPANCMDFNGAKRK
jgi:phosphatidylglycerophosphate synthase